MECPNCKEDLGVCIMEDVITCNGCDKEITISYNACSGCNFSWRNNDGRFMDGDVVDEESVSEVFDGLDAVIRSQPLLDDTDVPPEVIFHLDEEVEAAFVSVADEGTKKNMSSMIHKCIRCGEIVIPIDDYNYKCPYCNFEWEILGEEK